MHIETDRLVIRSPRQEDAAALLAIDTHPLVGRYIAGALADTPAEMSKRIAQRLEREAELGMAMWVVEERATGRIVGNCGLIPVEGKGPEVEVAYRFAPDVWNRGYATEACRACIHHGFDAVGLDRIMAFFMPGNGASERVMQKCGMTRLGPGRRHDTDVIEYEITRARARP